MVTLTDVFYSERVIIRVKSIVNGCSLCSLSLLFDELTLLVVCQSTRVAVKTVKRDCLSVFDPFCVSQKSVGLLFVKFVGFIYCLPVLLASSNQRLYGH